MNGLLTCLIISNMYVTVTRSADIIQHKYKYLAETVYNYYKFAKKLSSVMFTCNKHFTVYHLPNTNIHPRPTIKQPLQVWARTKKNIQYINVTRISCKIYVCSTLFFFFSHPPSLKFIKLFLKMVNNAIWYNTRIYKNHITYNNYLSLTLLNYIYIT